MTTPDLQPQSQAQVDNPTAMISKRPKRVSGRVQSYMVQEFVFNRLMAMKAEIEEKGGLSQRARDEANAIASTVKAWESAQERVRINRGKPLPGTLKPTKEKPKRKPAFQLHPIEPTRQ